MHRFRIARAALPFLAALALLPVARSQSDYATPYTITTLAGQVGVSGYQDGTGTAALFSQPEGVAADPFGNLYVADTYNYVIRRITSDGVVSTFAGTPGVAGRVNGTGSAAQFYFPAAVATDSKGNLYVLDENEVRVVTSSGVVTTLAGSQAIGFANGTGAAAEFNNPLGLAVGSDGTVYVADTLNYCVRTINQTGLVGTLAGYPGATGSHDGTGTAAQFTGPTGVAVDSQNNLYVTDADGNNTIRKITSGGVVTTFVGVAGDGGFTDGTGSAALFYSPYGIAIDSAGNLYVSVGNETIRKITGAGVVTTLAGSNGSTGSADGTGSAAQFRLPDGIAVDAAGDLFVADTGNQTIRERYAAAAAAPSITEQPDGQVAVPGQSLTFSVSATGVPAPSYQWLLNGQPIANATNPTLTLPGVSQGNAGDYSVVVTNSQGSVTSATAALTLGAVASPRLVNISTRAFVGTGTSVAIAGFYVSGPAGSTETVLVRGVGPALSNYSITNPLANPVLTLYNAAGQVIATNTGWGNGTSPSQAAAAAASSGAFALASGSADCALVSTLPPGAYTAEVSGQGAATGVALVEVYEVTVGAAQLVNISTRAFVGTQADVEIAGFVISGSQPLKVLVRGVGPTLSEFGLAGVLQQPLLNIVDSSGHTTATNTVWTSNPQPLNGPGWSSISTEANLVDAAESTGAFALPTTSDDSALLIPLNPGAYTAVIDGVGGTTGLALAEVYVVP